MFLDTYTFKRLFNLFVKIDSDDTGYVPKSCKPHMDWAFNVGKFSQQANEWYKDMKKITGVEPRDASLEDFQRIFKCIDLAPEACNKEKDALQFPLTCTYPPCNVCTINQPGK